MAESYTLNFGREYVLSLFQQAVEEETSGTRLERYAYCITNWYEEQLENDELDWEISSIPSLVYSDIAQSRMVVITEQDEEFDEIDKLYEENGIGSVDSDYIARICYISTDNDGHKVYLCQKEV